MPNTEHRRSAAIVLTTCLLAVATYRTKSGGVDSAPPAPQAGAGSLDACSLLTRAEVQTATKKPVLAPAKSQVANMASCGFGDPKDATSKVVDLNVLVAANDADAQGVEIVARDGAEGDERRDLARTQGSAVHAHDAPEAQAFFRKGRTRRR